MTDPDSVPITIRQAVADDHAACEAILRELPDWFGIPEATDAYAADLRRMRTIVALDRTDRVAGFLTMNPHNDAAMEIQVMAVARGYHRRGIGRALVEAASAIAVDAGHRVLEVKTLGPSHPDENYATTRRFYRRAGFLPVGEFMDLWPGNPCLIMVKVLDN